MSGRMLEQNVNNQQIIIYDLSIMSMIIDCRSIFEIRIIPQDIPLYYILNRGFNHTIIDKNTNLSNFSR